MSTKDNGGPAFPVMGSTQNMTTGETVVHQTADYGMTLRDYFAAKAMQASMATEPDGDAAPCDHARYAYQMADAMLEARKK